MPTLFRQGRLPLDFRNCLAIDVRPPSAEPPPPLESYRRGAPRHRAGWVNWWSAIAPKPAKASKRRASS